MLLLLGTRGLSTINLTTCRRARRRRRHVQRTQHQPEQRGRIRKQTALRGRVPTWWRGGWRMLSEIFCRAAVSGRVAGVGLGSGVPRVIYFDVTRTTALFPKQDSTTLGAGWHSARRWFVYSRGGGEAEAGATSSFHQSAQIRCSPCPPPSHARARAGRPRPTSALPRRRLDDDTPPHNTTPCRQHPSASPSSRAASSRT